MSHFVRESEDGEGLGMQSSVAEGIEETGDQEKCNLIINYLPHEIDDTTLKTLFAEHGEILSAKVVRDKITKKSLGYGFVKFLSPEDARDAVEKKNGLNIGHKVIKVSVARSPSDDIRNCKLYVTNLPKDFGEQEVIDLFSQFGDIIECRVLKERHVKVNRGVAFVQFDVKLQAQNAMVMNGFRPNGCDRCLVVKYAEDQHKKKERRPTGSMGSMMGMDDVRKSAEPTEPFYYTTQRMALPSSPPGMHVMGSYMPPTQLVYHPQSQRSMAPLKPTNMQLSTTDVISQGVGGGIDHWYPSIAHVYDSRGQLLQPQISPLGIGSMHAQSLSYDQVPTMGLMSGQVAYPRSRPVHESPYGSSSGGGSVTVEVSNLPLSADLSLLHDLIGQYGRILSAQIEVETATRDDGDGTSRRVGVCSGRGFCTMAGMAQAQYAMQSLDGMTVFEGGLPLQVRIVYEGGGGERSSAGRAQAQVQAQALMMQQQQQQMAGPRSADRGRSL